MVKSDCFSILRKVLVTLKMGQMDHFSVEQLRRGVGCNRNTSQKILLFLLKEYQNKIVIFVFLHFKFCPAIEKCDYVTIF